MAKTKEKDYRIGQKVVATIEIDNRGQDFTELDVLESGVLLGYSVMFKNGRCSLLGIGALDGVPYYTATEILAMEYPNRLKVKGLYIYFYDTGEKKPLPWEASTLRYSVLKIKEPTDPNRFVK